MKNKVLAGFLIKKKVKQNKYRCWTFSEPFNLDFTGFSVCIYVPRGIAEDRNMSTALTAQNAPDTRESCSRAATLPPAAPVRRLFTRTRQAAEPRGHPRCDPRADITTKAQMTPHFCFVHRNESWNNYFILHYWQRTILTLTLVACSNASISCHCLSSEMKTAL